MRRAHGCAGAAAPRNDSLFRASLRRLYVFWRTERAQLPVHYSDDQTDCRNRFPAVRLVVCSQRLHSPVTVPITLRMPTMKRPLITLLLMLCLSLLAACNTIGGAGQIGRASCRARGCQ